MKKICLVLVVLFALMIVLPGCGGGDDSLPYVGPIDGGDQPDDGGVTPTPPDGGGTPTPPPPPPTDGDEDGDLQPPAPPIF